MQFKAKTIQRTLSLQRILRKSALRLYLCCAEIVDYDEFIKELSLPDTFNSWFRISELHMWLCTVRLASEGPEGKFIRNEMLKALWVDAKKRGKKLGGTGYYETAESIDILCGQLKFAFVAYDEGLLSDDKTLAGAVWRNFFEMKSEDATKIDKLVEFIRKQVINFDIIVIIYLEKQDSSIILPTGLMTFLPLKGHAEDEARTKAILKEILSRT
ncbi:DgyrCDS4062 [Dimorphilus gyrociliatus]|uniref:DgyrCDS4062 n=1 Tax=Dimorphilus gyrociliatus TaxID=2664684 RepID=A0A7I8VHY0_9ANNE|nr:DgyrCDS4062 [Dimorphilus gyrociliatus]